MIEEKNVRELLMSIVKNKEPLTWDSNFDFRDTDLDSLDIVALALKLEELSGIRIPDDSISEIRSITSTCRVVNTLII